MRHLHLNASNNNQILTDIPEEYKFIISIVGQFIKSETELEEIFNIAVEEYKNLKSSHSEEYVEKIKIWHIRQHLFYTIQLKNQEAQLDEIEHYKNFPLMKPFIGENYLDAKKKILVIGESHFFSHEPTSENPSPNPEINTGPSKWYSSTQKDLHLSKFDSINTRKILSTPNHMVFREIEKVLSNSLQILEGRAIESIVFMNGFQRPANKRGQSMEGLASEPDYIVAIKTISEVIKIMKPNFVIFISKFAWEKIGKNLIKEDNIVYDFTYHPASIKYWNDAPNATNPTGKLKFEEILKREY